MFDILDSGYIRSKIWFSNIKEEFKSDERGVSGIVATVILVLCAVLLAVFFWDKISGLVQKLWNQTDTAATFNGIE